MSSHEIGNQIEGKTPPSSTKNVPRHMLHASNHYNDVKDLGYVLKTKHKHDDCQ
jgi:hypothetical protein